MRTVLQNIFNLTRMRTHALCAKVQYLSWPRGAIGSSYEDYSVTKTRKKNSCKHGLKASIDQVLRKLRFGKPDSV